MSLRPSFRIVEEHHFISHVYGPMFSTAKAEFAEIHGQACIQVRASGELVRCCCYCRPLYVARLFCLGALDILPLRDAAGHG